MHREARILLPVKGNDGRAFPDGLVDSILSDVLLHFGGYTVTEARGAWRCPDTGRVYSAPMLAVDVAVNVADPTPTAWAPVLYSIAERAAALLSQEYIYVRSPFGGVMFVKARAAVCAAVAA